MDVNEKALSDKITQKLAEWAVRTRDNLEKSEWDHKHINFVVEHVRESVEYLLSLSTKLRKMASVKIQKQWSTWHGTKEDMLAQGQRVTSMLFSWGLRESISDPIQDFYGINYSGLKVYPAYKNTATQQRVYLTYCPEFTHHKGDYSLMTPDGYTYLSKEQFEEDYEPAN